MKNRILKSILFSLVATALVAAPGISRAQDDTNAPAAAPAKAKKPTFKGKATAVDTAAMTLTVSGKAGDQVIYITSETRLSKNGKPATLEDIMVGDSVSGSYKLGDDGKMNATMIRDGLKMKKKKAESSDTSTNAPAMDAPSTNAPPTNP